jgi:hypothetical protein
MVRSSRLDACSSPKQAMKLIRAGGSYEDVDGNRVLFTGSMLAGQFAYDTLRASQSGAVDVTTIRTALDSLWKVRHYFDLHVATGYALGLAHADA